MTRPAHQFQPGNNANPSGRRKGTPFTDALHLSISELEKKGDPKSRRKLRVIAEALVEKAMTGDIQAIKEVADRLDGKPVQQQILSGDPDAPLHTVSTSPLPAEVWATKYGKAANQD